MFVGITAGLAAGALWGMVFVVPRMTLGLSSVDLTAGRFISYGVMSMLVMAFTWRRQALPTFSQTLAALGMSVLGATGYYLLLSLSIHRVGSEVPTLIIGTIPIWIMLLGKPSGLRWSSLWPGLVLTTAGLALMMSAMQPAQTVTESGDSRFWWGVLLAMAAMVCWTAFALLNAAWLKRHPEVSVVTWTNWLGMATGLGAWLLWCFLGSTSNELLALDGIGLIAIICVVSGVGSAWVAGIFWSMASRRLSVSLCGQLIVSETLFGLLYSFLWDGAMPSPLQWVAAVLFTLGILASIRAHQ